MTTITNTGIINSFSNTPQAKDGLYTVATLGGIISEDNFSKSGALIEFTADGWPRYESELNLPAFPALFSNSLHS